MECRVLGALIEKALATPQHYPLSEQALVAACNQTTNREPVTEYGVAEVRRALIALRRAGLAREVHQPGARVEKHRHTVEDSLGLEPGEVAVLALLLLRGPQTPGELRSRATRLHAFDTVADVTAALDALAGRAPPLVEHLERQPGQKEARHRHLLGEEELLATAAEAPPARPAATPAAAGADTDGIGARDDVAELREEVSRLRDEVAELRARVASLEGQAPR